MPNAQPIFHPKPPVPLPASPMVDEELKRSEQSSVIKPASYSNWAPLIAAFRKK